MPHKKQYRASQKSRQQAEAKQRTSSWSNSYNQSPESAQETKYLWPSTPHNSIPAPPPNVNIWAKRMEKQAERKQLTPHNEYEEEAMIKKAMEISHREEQERKLSESENQPVDTSEEENMLKWVMELSRQQNMEDQKRRKMQEEKFVNQMCSNETKFRDREPAKKATVSKNTMYESLVKGKPKKVEARAKTLPRNANYDDDDDDGVWGNVVQDIAPKHSEFSFSDEEDEYGLQNTRAGRRIIESKITQGSDVYDPEDSGGSLEEFGGNNTYGGFKDFRDDHGSCDTEDINIAYNNNQPKKHVPGKETIASFKAPSKKEFFDTLNATKPSNTCGEWNAEDIESQQKIPTPKAKEMKNPAIEYNYLSRNEYPDYARTQNNTGNGNAESKCAKKLLISDAPDPRKSPVSDDDNFHGEFQMGPSNDFKFQKDNLNRESPRDVPVSSPRERFMSTDSQFNNKVDPSCLLPKAKPNDDNVRQWLESSVAPGIDETFSIRAPDNIQAHENNKSRCSSVDSAMELEQKMREMHTKNETLNNVYYPYGRIDPPVQQAVPIADPQYRLPIIPPNITAPFLPANLFNPMMQQPMMMNMMTPFCFPNPVLFQQLSAFNALISNNPALYSIVPNNPIMPGAPPNLPPPIQPNYSPPVNFGVDNEISIDPPRPQADSQSFGNNDDSFSIPPPFVRQPKDKFSSVCSAFEK